MKFQDVGYLKLYINPENATDFSVNGIDIRRCDYYKYIKCFCLETNKQFYPLGKYHEKRTENL